MRFGLFLPSHREVFLCGRKDVGYSACGRDFCSLLSGRLLAHFASAYIVERGGA